MKFRMHKYYSHLLYGVTLLYHNCTPRPPIHLISMPLHRNQTPFVRARHLALTLCSDVIELRSASSSAGPNRIFALDGPS
jgi:hypothetical protein